MDWQENLVQTCILSSFFFLLLFTHIQYIHHIIQYFQLNIFCFCFLHWPQEFNSSSCNHRFFFIIFTLAFWCYQNSNLKWLSILQSKNKWLWLSPIMWAGMNNEWLDECILIMVYVKRSVVWLMFLDENINHWNGFQLRLSINQDALAKAVLKHLGRFCPLVVKSMDIHNVPRIFFSSSLINFGLLAMEQLYFLTGQVFGIALKPNLQ